MVLVFFDAVRTGRWPVWELSIPTLLSRGECWPVDEHPKEKAVRDVPWWLWEWEPWLGELGMFSWCLQGSDIWWFHATETESLGQFLHLFPQNVFAGNCHSHYFSEATSITCPFHFAARRSVHWSNHRLIGSPHNAGCCGHQRKANVGASINGNTPKVGWLTTKNPFEMSAFWVPLF